MAGLFEGLGDPLRPGLVSAGVADEEVLGCHLGQPHRQPLPELTGLSYHGIGQQPRLRIDTSCGLDSRSVKCG
jgi:hypothetical protein